MAVTKQTKQKNTTDMLDKNNQFPSEAQRHISSGTTSHTQCMQSVRRRKYLGEHLVINIHPYKHH